MGYAGFKDQVLDAGEVTEILKESPENIFGLLENEYLIARDEKQAVIDTFKCKGKNLIKVPYKNITTKFAGKVKAKNIHQKLAIDMLYDNDTTIKVITGRFGTGELSCPRRQ